jgi:HEAT repeat protein
MNYSPESVQRLLDSDDYGDRLSGVNQLRYLAPEIAFEMLQPLINDSNARVRYSAVSQLDILGRQNLDLALTILRDRLLNDPEADVKAATGRSRSGVKINGSLR